MTSCVGEGTLARVFNCNFGTTHINVNVNTENIYGGVVQFSLLRHSLLLPSLYEYIYPQQKYTGCSMHGKSTQL